MPSREYSDFSYSIPRGDDATLPIAITLGGAAVDISDYEIWVTGKRAIDNDATDAAALFQYSIGDGVEVTDAEAGLAEVVISGDDTAALTSNATVYVDVQCESGGRIWTAATGKLSFWRDVTVRRT